MTTPAVSAGDAPPKPPTAGSLSADALAPVAGVALAAAIVGDQILRAEPWGLNFPLWIGVCAGGAAWVTARARRSAWWREAGWYAPAFFFALCVAWRDGEQLLAWNVLGVALALLLPTLRLRTPSLPVTRLGAYLLEPLRVGLGVTIGPLVSAAEDVDWAHLAPQRRARHVTAVVIGLLLAVPVALIFGSLLASADPLFERAVRWLFDWDFATIASHVVVTAFLTWVGAGYLLGLLGSGLPRYPVAVHRGRPRLGLVELAIPLGVLGLLFVTFIAIQARYLFGGEALVLSTAGLSYAEYARRGFFELIAVTGLLLPVLLAADWLLDARDPKVVRRFRLLTAFLLVLTVPIIASALERMRLYVDAYGLSQDRLYALSVMVWVVLALAWFATTVLRGVRDRFAFGAAVAGFAVLAALNAANPDGTVARVNLARADDGRELDTAYLLNLSADAVPTVLEGLATRNVAVACAGLESLRDRWQASETPGWRGWNVDRARARAAVRELDDAWAGGCVAE